MVAAGILSAQPMTGVSRNSPVIAMRQAGPGGSRPRVAPGLVARSGLLGSTTRPGCSRGPHRNVRQNAASVPAPGGGGVGGTGGFSGSGGGGGGGDGDAEKGGPFGGLIKGWEQRVAADPQFVYKVFVEQVIGVGASVVGDMASRPNWGLSELDFVFATLVVGSIVNFALMYLLAPTGAATVSTKNMGLLQKLFSESTLKGMGAPGGHMFEPGFSFKARATNFVYKGFVFAFVGMCAGLTGTAVSNGLLLLRKQLDPNFKTQNTPPNVIYNAATWALHMGASSNLRYQMLNGADMVLQPMMHPGFFKLFSAIVRSANNAVGGITFVMLAKLFGVQQSAPPETATA